MPWLHVLAAAVLCLVVLQPVLGHGPPLGAGVHDDLALVERDWTVTAVEPEVFDLDGPAFERDAPDVAFRVHADAMLVEGVLTIPDPARDAPPPAYNIGVRLVDIRLEPPLALDEGATLSRILLGPLLWPELTHEEPFGAHLLHGEVVVPWPDADGVSPSEDPNETRLTDVILRASFTVVEAADADDLDDPDALHGRRFLSPAELRIDLGLSRPDQGTARLGTLFDFVHATDAEVVAVDGWEGIRLERDARHAHLFAVGRDHGYGARGPVLPAEGPVRTPSPVAMNITATPDGDAHAWTLGLGFAMPRSAWTPTTETPSPTGEDRKTPAPSVTALLVTLALLVLGGRVTRLPRRRP